MGPSLISKGPPLTLGPSEKHKLGILSAAPWVPTVLRSPWIDLKGIVENPSYIFRPPKSKLIIRGLATIALILSRQAPKLISGDPFNKLHLCFCAVGRCWMLLEGPHCRTSHTSAHHMDGSGALAKCCGARMASISKVLLLHKAQNSTISTFDRLFHLALLL